MKATAQDGPGLHLLLELEDEPGRSRRRRAALISVLFHVAVIISLGLDARLFPPAKRGAALTLQEHITLLFTPPQELTQKEPNRTPPSKMFLGEPEPARPPLLVVPKALFSAPPPAKGDLSREEKPPQLVPKPEPTASNLLAQIMPPPSPPPAPPKLVLENPNSAAGGRQGAPQIGALNPQRPGEAIEGAVRNLSRSAGRGGTVVGDGYGGGVPEGFTLPTPGAVGSNLELLSDPMGVDFRPYLTRILATVRRNWYAVIPESARMGMIRGRVAIQFMIVRPGAVAKLVIAAPSGTEALDRAAIAGISASNPFPPLPAEFRGDNVKLQFTFLYNIRINQ